MNHITKKAHLQALILELSEIGRLILDYMLKLKGFFSSVFVSQARIAASTGISRKTVNKYCQEFQRLGIFKIIHRPGKKHLKSNIYKFNDLLGEMKEHLKTIISYVKVWSSRVIPSFRLSRVTLMYKGSNNSKFFSSSSQDLSLKTPREQGTVTDQTNCLYVQSLLPPIPTSYGEGLCQSWFKILEGDASADTYHQMVNKLTEEIEDIFGGNRKSILEQLQIQELKDWFIINS